MRFVNKQLTANQKQAALLSATGSSGKQVKAKVKVQENVFCVNCQNEYSFHYQIYCVLLCHLLLTIYFHKNYYII